MSFLGKALSHTGGGFDLKGLLGGGGGNKHLDEARGVYGDVQANNAQNFALSRAATRRGGRAAVAGYGQAIRQVGGAKQASTLAAQDAGVQQGAQADQSLASRGLYNTTVLDNARAGISGGVTRQLAQIDSDYAQLLAGLQMGKGNAQAQMESQLAGTYQNQAQAGTQIGQQWINTLGSVQEEDPNAWLGSLLGIAGFAIGGPGGAMAANTFAKGYQNQNGGQVF